MKVAFVVTGWHFPESTFLKLNGLMGTVPGAEVFIVSHRAKDSLPVQTLKSLDKFNTLFESNIGYDWGCFQQFVNRDYWQSFDLIVFCHDDIDFINFNFLHPIQDLLMKGHKIIGNGFIDRDKWINKYPERLWHSKKRPENLDFEHSAVRGSFFCMTRDTLEALGGFEVLWDHRHLDIRFGNWSLIASCAKAELIFGPLCFAHLSKTHLKSDYIVEHFRGNSHKERPPLITRAKKKFKHISYESLTKTLRILGRRTLYPGGVLKNSSFTNMISKAVAKF